MASCGGCATTWTGLGIAHCGACHETFSTIKHFDTHRSERGMHGQCLDPAGLKRSGQGKYAGQPLLRRDRRGFWVDWLERPAELNRAAA